jgi:hypothetical protein
MPLQAFDQPLLVSVLEGEVVITGAQGPTAVALTPEAAAKTAERIAEAARLAQASQAEVSED